MDDFFRLVTELEVCKIEDLTSPLMDLHRECLRRGFFVLARILDQKGNIRHLQTLEKIQKTEQYLKAPPNSEYVWRGAFSHNKDIVHLVKTLGEEGDGRTRIVFCTEHTQKPKSARIYDIGWLGGKLKCKRCLQRWEKLYGKKGQPLIEVF